MMSAKATRSSRRRELASFRKARRVADEVRQSEIAQISLGMAMQRASPPKPRQAACGNQRSCGCAVANDSFPCATSRSRSQTEMLRQFSEQRIPKRIALTTNRNSVQLIGASVPDANKNPTTISFTGNLCQIQPAK